MAATNVRLSGAQPTARSEADVRFNYNDLQQIIGASNNNGGSTQAQFYSGDGGATWSQTSLPSVAGDNFQGDPAVDWTSDGNAWALAVGVGTTKNQLRSFRSTDAGKTWSFDSTVSGTHSNVDKPSLWVDHSPSSPHRDTMYALWWNSGPTYVARRAGTAGTWQAPQQVSGAETTGGSDGGDVKTNAFGDAFAFWPSEGSQQIYVAKSTDGGVNWGGPVKFADTFGQFLLDIPAQNTRTAGASRGALLYVSGGAYRTSTQDRVYACWADLAGGNGCKKPSDQPVADVTSSCKTRIWFASSSDGGAHWSTPAKINDQSSKNDQFFPRLAVDETSGDLVVVYYDTVGDPGRIKTDVWMQSSRDGGISWTSAEKLTSQQTDESADQDSGNQYGDYLGLTGYAGQYFACWTDRRSGGVEEIWGAPYALVAREATFELHRDHVGQDEIDGARTQPDGPVVLDAFALGVDGFTARELGITGASSFNLGPAVTFTPATGVTARCVSLDSTDPAFSPDKLQHFRFHYNVDFGPDDRAFTNFGGLTETVNIAATFHDLPAAAQLTLMKQPDPYLLQGTQTWWLSNDIRFVQVARGDTRFGVTMGTDPFKFLADVTAALTTGQGNAGGESFDANTEEQDEVISTAPLRMRGLTFEPVFNFAIARVHYRALAQPATNVRVFFRLFAANSTSTDFQTTTTYRRSPSAYPVPAGNIGQHVTATGGIANNDYVSVPCYGVPRQPPAQVGAANSLPALQFDSFNDKTLATTGGPVRDTFYGCFLDINQSANALPRNVPAGNPDGPWPSGSGIVLEPLQAAFIRNDHQCLVAEIAFDPVPIRQGTQPFNSDKLAQRNLSWSTVANPGVAASRLAFQNFEVRPTPASAFVSRPDDIEIDWLNVPPGQTAEVYLPEVDADAVLQAADQLYPDNWLTKIDANTIGCVTGGVTYIPLPPATGNRNFVGLINVSLPSGIIDGQLYRVLVRQLTDAFGRIPGPPLPPPRVTAAQRELMKAVIPPGDSIAGPPRGLAHWRRTIGAFQINIPVSTKSKMLEREELRLSLFRWIAKSIAPNDRWYPIFKRYLDLLEGKVAALGGDPDSIEPSFNGYDGLPGGRGPCGEVPPGEGLPTHAVTGKVEAVIYDHFGDFEGFILELFDGRHRRFNSREHDVERLVVQACENRVLVTVEPLTNDAGRVDRLFLRATPGWR
jgi:hypothetical protein